MKPNEPPDASEVMALKEVMEQFVQERLAPKLEALDKQINKAASSEKQEDRDKLSALESKREKLLADYQLDAWLEKAAKDVLYVQRATHAAKFTHSSIKVRLDQSTDLYMMGGNYVEEEQIVGSHLLTSESDVDTAVKDAKYLYIGNFLNFKHNGRSLLDRILSNEPSMAAALSDDPVKAKHLMAEFASFTGKGKTPASHTLAKQVYFPLADGGYHLLAPLFPTSLVHAVYTRMRLDRFSEETKLARQARKNNKPHAHGFRNYPNLAVQVFVGSNPQNISQLNSERHGENRLLPSLPPIWRSTPVALPLGPKSIFQWSRFYRRRTIREFVDALTEFLGKTDYNNVHIRRKRAALVQGIVDELLHFAEEIRGQEPGWTSDERCRLNQSEALWLDPGRAETDPEFAGMLTLGQWQEEVAHRFANWFNGQLRTGGKRKKLPVGEAEAAEWKKVLENELAFFRRELAYA